MPTDVERLLKANRDYRKGESSMSDREYDKLERQCLEEYPKFRDEILAIRDDLGGENIPHINPMGSLDKTNDCTIWATSNGNCPLLIAEKVDGASVELVYVEGKLRRCVTRGDGERGTLVTENVSASPDVPDTLVDSNGRLPAGIVAVRGEVCMGWDTMQDINEALSLTRRNKTFTHPRNAAVGIMRSTSDSAIYAPKLSFRAFGMLQIENGDDLPGEHTTLHDTYRELEEFGFTAPIHTVLEPDKDRPLREQIDAAVQQVIDAPNNIPKDGAVVSLDPTFARVALGFSDDGRHVPLGAVAVKAYDPLAQQKEMKMAILKFHTGDEIKSVCLTGKPEFPEHNRSVRSEIQRELENYGIEVTSSVTGRTNLLVCGDMASNSSKMKKARLNGIAIVTYETLFNAIDNEESIKRQQRAGLER